MNSITRHLKKVGAENGVILALIGIKFIINLVLNQNYGYFRDEFFYMQLSERLFDGPIDMPLLSPLLMWITRTLLGDSLTALHVLPTLAGSLVILLTVRMVCILGGGFGAQLTAGLCVLLAPVNLGLNSTFSYDSFDQLFQVLSFYFVVKLLKTENSKGWLWFGLAAGLGLLTKQSMLILGLAFTLALLSTPARKYFRERWIWIAAAMAFAGFLPYLLMQMQLDWPIFSYSQHYTFNKTYPVSPIEFLFFQIITQNPLTMPIWLTGLFFLLFKGKRFRMLGFTFLFLFGILVLLRAKFYFLAPAFPVFFAFGAVQISNFLENRKLSWIGKVYIPVLILSGALLAPFALPLLPVEDFIAYSRGPGGNLGVKHERTEEGALPQFFADRFGWPELANEVVGIYQELPPEAQKKVCVFTGNYGEAGAIQFFGKADGLTRVLSGHGQYYYWGPGDCTGEIVIAVGIPRAALERIFNQVTLARIFTCEYCMSYENNLPIFVCRELKLPLGQLWPQIRHLD